MPRSLQGRPRSMRLHSPQQMRIQYFTSFPLGFL
jgi:hypothetical protein